MFWRSFTFWFRFLYVGLQLICQSTRKDLTFLFTFHNCYSAI
ncbi:hypothetical protein [Escherichia phage dw-ec]|nr:hypothetical protein [Escherichia phage BI-EHEC]UJQ43813.1 hypothetical protein [Escherichia phage dw-ec]